MGTEDALFWCQFTIIIIEIDARTTPFYSAICEEFSEQH
jgi:hypothetical protein